MSAPPRNLSAAETHALDSLIGHALHTGVHPDDLQDFIRSSIEMWQEQYPADLQEGQR